MRGADIGIGANRPGATIGSGPAATSVTLRPDGLSSVGFFAVPLERRVFWVGAGRTPDKHMAGSFQIFRRYQKAALAGLAIMAMLAFFVLPPVLQMGSAGGPAADTVVVKW